MASRDSHWKTLLALLPHFILIFKCIVVSSPSFPSSMDLIYLTLNPAILMPRTFITGSSSSNISFFLFFFCSYGYSAPHDGSFISPFSWSYRLYTLTPHHLWPWLSLRISPSLFNTHSLTQSLTGFTVRNSSRILFWPLFFFFKHQIHLSLTKTDPNWG